MIFLPKGRKSYLIFMVGVRDGRMQFDAGTWWLAVLLLGV